MLTYSDISQTHLGKSLLFYHYCKHCGKCRYADGEIMCGTLWTWPKSSVSTCVLIFFKNLIISSSCVNNCIQ